MCRQCVGGLLYYTQHRADAQFEKSILGSVLGKPTGCSMIALKRVARYSEFLVFDRHGCAHMAACEIRVGWVPELLSKFLQHAFFPCHVGGFALLRHK